MSKYDKILGLIPARYASSRFPGKPLADIGGKPMIQRVYEQAKKVLPTVCVATDDERIRAAVETFGGKVVMTSDKHKSGTDRCAEALDIIESQLNTKFDAVLNIQGDEPFIEPEQIRTLADMFDRNEVEIATLVKKAECKADVFNPNKPKVVVANDGKALYFSRQAIPYLRGVDETEWTEKYEFYNHIGLYGYRADVLRRLTKLPQGILERAESLEQLRWLENGFAIYVSRTELESLSVDTPDDLEELRRRGLI